jgi:hypothetical protein
MRVGGSCFLADPFTNIVHPTLDIAFFLEECNHKQVFTLRHIPSWSIKKVVVLWPQS